MAGLQDVTNGNALPDTTIDEIAKQATPQYASTAIRDADAVLTAALREGLNVYLLDTNKWAVYTGSAYSSVGPIHGALTAYTAAVVQLGAVTVTNDGTWYSRVGRLIMGNFYVSVTGTGTLNNVVTITLPVAATLPAGVVGSGFLRDASAGQGVSGALKLQSTTTVAIAYGSAPDAAAYAGSSGSAFSAALASGDVIQGQFCYQAAADA